MRVRSPVVACGFTAVTLFLPGPSADEETAGAPFAILDPVVQIDDEEREQLDRREILVEGLPGQAEQIGVLAVGAIATDVATFVERVARPETLWAHEAVPNVRKFSVPPRLEDLADLRLSERDLDAVRDCRPADCDVKLGAAEIDRLREAIDAAGTSWRDAVQTAFREIVFERVTAYVEEGFDALPPYHDHEEPVRPGEAFDRLLLQFPWLLEADPRIADHFGARPRQAWDADSFLYWLETTYTPRPLIQVNHVALTRTPPDTPSPVTVIVASRQVYASHYLDASVGLSLLMRDPAEPDRQYLVYVNRTSVDGLQGWLGWLKRAIVERRVREQARRLFGLQRERLER